MQIGAEPGVTLILSPDSRWALVRPVGTAACLGRSPRARRGVLLSLLTLIPLIACAGSPSPSRGDANDEAGRLFGRAYSQVMEYYLEPLTARDAALAALKKLTTLDAEVTVSDASGAIELRDAGRLVERVKSSPDRDWRGWGGLLMDEKEAATWFRKAAEQGNAGGEWQLGELYEYGRGGLRLFLCEPVASRGVYLPLSAVALVPDGGGLV